MAAVTAVPARYAKFITALAGVAIGYLTAYGTTWNLQGALVAIGAALAVFGVPNAAAPVPAAPPVTGRYGIPLGPIPPDAKRIGPSPIPGIRPPEPPSVTSTPPATDRPTGGITP